MPCHYSIQYISEWHHEVYVGSSCHSLAMKTASCPANCRQPCSRSWRRGKTSWTKWMEKEAKVRRCTESTSGGSVASPRVHMREFYPTRAPPRSAGWPELTGVGRLREVLRGTGGPLRPPHGGVLQRKQRAPARQFPQIPPVPRRPAVPAAFHGHSDVRWVHPGQGAGKGRRTRYATQQFRFESWFLTPFYRTGH